MKILDEWLRDMPQQFQGKPKIEILVNAFAKQIQELYEVHEQLETKTDIDTAEAYNLDMVGNIVSMTRKEATHIVRQARDTVLSDDVYRQALRYKRLKNSSDCTYEDIMETISLLWDTDQVTYYEDPERPATISMILPTVDIDGIDPSLGRILSIKPGGVAMIYIIAYIIEAYISLTERVDVPSMELSMKFPYWDIKYFDGTWLLDGSVFLDAYSIPLGVGILMGAYKAQIEEKTQFGISATLGTQTSEYADFSVIDIVTSDKLEESVGANSSITIQENLGVDDIEATLITRKNLWYLDGTYDLSGTKLLNAEYKKEVL